MANTLDKIKLSGVTYDLIDSTAIHSMDGYWTSGQTESAITAATAALAETVGQELSGKVDNDTYTAYTAATDSTLSGKADTTAVTQSISEATSGKVDTSTYTAYTAATEAVLSGKADASDLTSLFGAVDYDSNTKRINFYHESTTGTVLAYVDATDFIKDGMVDNVEVKDVEISGETVTCLVITFNTDAGKEEIDIPISDIFDASNYYTKDEVDQAISGFAESTAVTQEISEAVSGKADTTAVTQSINEAVSGKADSSDVQTLSGTVTGMNATLTAHTADTTIHVTSSDKTTWSGKQDALVSGTNIKTINGESVLGSGNISVQTLPTVSGTTLVFS